MSTKTTTPPKMKHAKRLSIRATCPHCGFDINPIPFTDMTIHTASPKLMKGDQRTDDGWQTRCESCCEPFVVPDKLVRDIQHAALTLIGEA